MGAAPAVGEQPTQPATLQAPPAAAESASQFGRRNRDAGADWLFELDRERQQEEDRKRDRRPEQEAEKEAKWERERH